MDFEQYHVLKENWDKQIFKDLFDNCYMRVRRGVRENSKEITYLFSFSNPDGKIAAFKISKFKNPGTEEHSHKEYNNWFSRYYFNNFVGEKFKFGEEYRTSEILESWK